MNLQDIISDEVIIKIKDKNKKKQKDEKKRENIDLLKNAYKFFILGNTGYVVKVIIFCNKKDFELTDKEIIEYVLEIIDDEDKSVIPSSPPEIHFANLQIHKDDSINTIKKKIIIESGKDNICYGEIYMFANISSITPFGATKKEKNTTPIGQKFIHTPDPRFIVNPYLIEDYLFELSNPLVSYENRLLLNHPNIQNNIIFICLANSVLTLFDGVKDRNILEKIVKIYYPFLYKIGIIDNFSLQRQRQLLLEENKGIEKLIPFYDSVSLFYDTYRERESRGGDLDYTYNGIKKFQILIDPEMDILLPLEVIFKNIHSTKSVPFIKYNPGNRQENIYRLYTEEKTKTGKNIPFMKETDITRLSKEIGKSRQISLFILPNKDESPIYIDIENNGKIRIYSNLIHPLSSDEILEMLKKMVNPVIKNMNSFLDKTGYALNEIGDDIHSLQFVDIHYSIELQLNKKISIGDYAGCISPLFDILNEETGELLFKRVDNFVEMDAQTALIINVYKKTNDPKQVIDALMKSYSLTEDRAAEIFLNYVNEHKDVRGKINMDNIGFIAFVQNLTNYDSRIKIDVLGVNSIEFLDVLFIYFDFILRLAKFPKLNNEKCLKEQSRKKNMPSILKVQDVISTEKIIPQNDYENDDELLLMTDDDKKIVKTKSYEDVDDDEDGGLFFYDEDADDADIQNMIEEEEKDEFTKDNDEVNPEEDEEDEDENEDEEFNEKNLFETENEIDNNKKINIETEPFDISKKIVDDDSVDVSADNESTNDKDDDESVDVSADNDDDFMDDSVDIQEEDKLIEEKIDEIESYSPKKELSTPPSSSSSIPFRSKNLFDDVTGGKGDSKDSAESTVVDKNPSGINLKHPNLFLNMLKERQPILFATDEENPNFKGYSRMCQSNQRVQPIILNETEFQKINKQKPLEQKEYIKYGTKDNEQYYYICPRYWCLLSNTSMTEEDVIQGKCAKAGKPDKIIPYNAEVIPKDAFVYEFNNPKQHMKDGKYMQHYPGFLKEKHPKGFSLPCCYKKPFNNRTAKTDENNTINFHEKKKRKKDDLKKQTYIISNETFPMRERDRFGFLPLPVQFFLQLDNNSFISKNNSALIKSNMDILLRYSVEQQPRQSILGSIADLYSFKQGLDRVPSVAELKKIIARVIDLDHFIQYNNSSLLSVFKEKQQNNTSSKRKEFNIEDYSRTELYKLVDKSNEKQMVFFEEAVRSYKNFISFILSNDSFIDHTYLWDLITDNNSFFIKGGVNLIILEQTDDDLTSNIKMVCPTNMLNMYDPRKSFFILLKKGDYYEPLYLYKETDGVIVITKTFFKQTAIKNIKTMLNIIQKVASTKCNPLPSIPIYKFKRPIDLHSMTKLLKGFTILFQVSNFQGKIIGVLAKDNDLPEIKIFLPCYPSSRLPNPIPTIFIDNEKEEIWTDYEMTIEYLKKFHEKTGIPCIPKVKVIEDGLIVGVLTETNQFVKIDPPNQSIRNDDLETLERDNYILPDLITSSNEEDEERLEVIRNIELESQFFNLFRTKLRGFLNETQNEKSKQIIVDLIEGKTKMDYPKKLKFVKRELEKLASNKITFSLIDTDVLADYYNISCSSCEKETPYCIKNIASSKEECKLVLPEKHLISGKENKKIYFTRIADELIRFNRIRLFMINPKSYLNITNTDYKINKNEFILIQSSLNNNYLKGLVPFNKSSNINNVGFDTAAPQFSQSYLSNVSLTDQYKGIEDVNNRLNDNTTDGIISEKAVIGNRKDSIWKRIFPESVKEIIFKNNPIYSFYVLVYIYQDKYKEAVRVSDIKRKIWEGYCKLFPKYREQIFLILEKRQGKKTMVRHLKKIKTDEEICNELKDKIMDDDFYLTDLDILIFANIAKIQICLFSREGLKSLMFDGLEWIIINEKYNEKHYFIRSAPISGENKGSYHLINTPYSIGQLDEFSIAYQNTEDNIMRGGLDDYFSLII